MRSLDKDDLFERTLSFHEKKASVTEKREDEKDTAKKTTDDVDENA